MPKRNLNDIKIANEKLIAMRKAGICVIDRRYNGDIKLAFDKDLIEKTWRKVMQRSVGTK